VVLVVFGKHAVPVSVCRHGAFALVFGIRLFVLGKGLVGPRSVELCEALALALLAHMRMRTHTLRTLQCRACLVDTRRVLLCLYLLKQPPPTRGAAGRNPTILQQAPLTPARTLPQTFTRALARAARGSIRGGEVRRHIPARLDEDGAFVEGHIESLD